MLCVYVFYVVKLDYKQQISAVIYKLGMLIFSVLTGYYNSPSEPVKWICRLIFATFDRTKSAVTECMGVFTFFICYVSIITPPKFYLT